MSGRRLHQLVWSTRLAINGDSRRLFPTSHPTTAPLPNPHRSKSLPFPVAIHRYARTPNHHHHLNARHRITKRSRSRSRNHRLSSSPTTPSGKRPSHPFPFADITDQDHHHGRSRVRGGGGWNSINELDARLGASSNPGPNLTGPGPSMIDALQCAFAALRPGAGFESVRVRAEGRVLPVFEDGEGDDDGPDVDSNPDLQAGGTSSLVPGIGSQGQHIKPAPTVCWRIGSILTDKEAAVDGAGKKMKPGTTG
ncbi:hypothetical protein BU17DRAFT_86526 [Hysterangium stoloniferum]|nr:hypothetical protein BU17DRAFT_86526 [Hysterangium stoloniferum]